MKKLTVGVLVVVLALSLAQVAQSQATYDFPSTDWATNQSPRADASGNLWTLYQVQQYNTWAWTGIELRYYEPYDLVLGGWNPATQEWDHATWLWNACPRYGNPYDCELGDSMHTAYGNLSAGIYMQPAQAGEYLWKGHIQVRTPDPTGGGALLRLVKWSPQVAAPYWAQTELGAYPVTFVGGVAELDIAMAGVQIASDELLGIQFESTTPQMVDWCLAHTPGDVLRAELVPEPGSLMALAVGGVGLAGFIRRRK